MTAGVLDRVWPDSIRREGPGRNPGPSQNGGMMSRCLGRLRFGYLVVALPSALELGLRLHYALERAAAGDAAVFAIAAGEFKRAFNDHSAADSGDSGLKCSPIAARPRMVVVVVAVLRALAVEQIRDAPVCDLRVVPQRVGRFLGAVNLGDIHRVIGLVGECERGLLREFPGKRSCEVLCGP